MGGIREVYIANYDDVENVTAESDQINAITMVAEKKFKKYLSERAPAA